MGSGFPMGSKREVLTPPPVKPSFFCFRYLSIFKKNQVLQDKRKVMVYVKEFGQRRFFAKHDKFYAVYNECRLKRTREVVNNDYTGKGFTV